MIERRRYITTKELAMRTGLSVRYFQKLAKRVSFASQPEPSGAILFDAAAFDAWLNAGRPKSQSRAKCNRRALRGAVADLKNDPRPLAEVLREKRAALEVELKKRNR